MADDRTILIVDDCIEDREAYCRFLSKNWLELIQRGSNVDTIPGLGLGLAIARFCTDLHGGTIELVSHPDWGTRITVNLPRRMGETV